jgi:hypothetical protein
MRFMGGSSPDEARARNDASWTLGGRPAHAIRRILKDIAKTVFARAAAIPLLKRRTVRRKLIHGCAGKVLASSLSAEMGQKMNRRRETKAARSPGGTAIKRRSVQLFAAGCR